MFWFCGRVLSCVLVILATHYVTLHQIYTQSKAFTQTFLQTSTLHFRLSYQGHTAMLKAKSIYSLMSASTSLSIYDGDDLLDATAYRSTSHSHIQISPLP
jgi:hypothetical protein